MNFLEEFRKKPFLGIIRGLPPEQVANCAEVCKSTGLKFAEVPLNTASAAVALEKLCEEGGKNGLIVGAGTVITEQDLQTALGCGAKFIVTPGTNPAVVKICVQKNIPCIPGALTPTEIMQAHALGATAIKIFPVSSLGGTQYIKELRGPFKNIPLLACGGVKAENVQTFFDVGCDFVSFGASVFSVSDMESGNWQSIEKKIIQLLR
ncbi:MAG: bifunctional 4-hydroxy-2-oxoglutarate aldolase/2-dehydro-3-deoxy-phosphogluconate aldolase [Fibromonadaceae bacterium]|jgi:2-dehydro-3-deoxyphosphogluconate aldolase/(4S)-4-hydroxy-2-oxoglutarate aldolase|nr:bifunctional 4-hydroxy-2-oxoglutarate aldolase/2-dehydro-3-deoxy-phosphogluconate aldolase [Fibromonadaceae bacterium]